MKIKISHLLFLFLVVLLIQCNKDQEIFERAYPRLNTLEITNILVDKIVLRAQILHRGDFEILSYGFVWAKSKNPIFELSEKIVFNQNIQVDSFSAEITSFLEKDVIYYARAFIKTPEYTVYGENQQFFSLGSKLPTISSVEPTTGTIGDTLIIRGSNFNVQQSTIRLLFNNDIEANILNSSDTLVEAIVPILYKSPYTLTIHLLNQVSNEFEFKITTPSIETVEMHEVAIDDTLIIRGSDFSYTRDQNIVEIGNVLCEIIYSNKHTLATAIPEGIKGGSVQLQITIANQSTSYAQELYFLEPNITDVNPKLVSFDDTVTISGENFSPIAENNKILIDNIRQVETIYASKTELKFLFPKKINRSQASIQIRVADKILKYDYLQVKPPEIFNISPSYIDVFETGEIIIRGDHFNVLNGKTQIRIDNKIVSIESIEKDRIVVQLPESIIPYEEQSFYDTLSINITVLDQNVSLSNGLIIRYVSIWEKLTDSPVVRVEGSISFSIGGKGYIGLGADISSRDGLNDMWEYDPDSDSWKQIADFPSEGRSYVANFVIGSKVYIVGGMKNSGDFYDSTGVYSEFWEFDVIANTWTQKSDFPGGLRARAFGFSLGNFGYVGGGNFAGNTFSDFWKYDLSSDSWSKLSQLPGSLATLFTTVVYDSNSAFVFGIKESNSREFYKYEESDDSWSMLSSIPTHSFRVTGIILGDYIIVGDDFPSDGRKRKFYKYSISSNLWETIILNEKYNSDRVENSFSIFGYGYFTILRTGHEKILWRLNPDKL